MSRQITDRSPRISSKLESSRLTTARTCQERASRSFAADAARWDRFALSPRQGDHNGLAECADLAATTSALEWQIIRYSKRQSIQECPSSIRPDHSVRAIAAV